MTRLGEFEGLRVFEYELGLGRVKSKQGFRRGLGLRASRVQSQTILGCLAKIGRCSGITVHCNAFGDGDSQHTDVGGSSEVILPAMEWEALEWEQLRVEGKPLLSGAAFGATPLLWVACRAQPCLVHIFCDTQIQVKSLTWLFIVSFHSSLPHSFSCQAVPNPHSFTKELSLGLCPFSSILPT